MILIPWDCMNEFLFKPMALVYCSRYYCENVSSCFIQHIAFSSHDAHLLLPQMPFDMTINSCVQYM
jgi:hypothetical protein